jgi:hypothetical protein
MYFFYQYNICRLHIGSSKATLSIGAGDDERLVETAADEGGEGCAGAAAGERGKRAPGDWRRGT